MNKRFFVLTITIASVLFLFQINLLAQPAVLHPCKPSTNSPVLSPNATITINGITGLSNCYRVGDAVSISVDYTNTDGNITIATTHEDCSTDVNSNSCNISLIMTNCTWTASVGSWSTNGSGTSAFFKPPVCGNGSVNFHVEWTNSCDGTTGSGGASGSFHVLELQHLCVETEPSDQTRTTIGVGEKVKLNLCGAFGSVTWSAPRGTLSSTNGNAVTYTAPNKCLFANSEMCAVTAECDCGTFTVYFSVLDPTSIIMTTFNRKHDYNTHVYVAPDSVNFSAVSVRDLDAVYSAIGVYLPLNGNHHGTTVPNACTSHVVTGKGTLATVSDDNVVSGLGNYNPTPTGNGMGISLCSIPCEWTADGVAWYPFAATADQVGNSSGTTGSPANHLKISKCGASWECSVYDSTITYLP